MLINLLNKMTILKSLPSAPHDLTAKIWLSLTTLANARSIFLSDPVVNKC